MRHQKREFILLFFALFGVAVILGSFGCQEKVEAATTPFGYRYIGTYGWVPSTDNNELRMSTALDRTPDLVVFRSSADWRMYLSMSNYMPTGSGILLNTSMSAASLDTLYDLGFPAPAAGITYYGQVLWSFAPASSDTIWIDGYVED